MALQPLPPIPNTRLVDDPARDAIWRRYLEQLFNRIIPLVNVHNDLTGLQGGTTNEYYHLTQAQHSTVTSFGTFTNNRVLVTGPTSSITTNDALQYLITSSTLTATNISSVTILSSSTATLPLVNIDGGNIDSTAIGANTASTGTFTNVSTATLFASGNVTLGDASGDSLTINAGTWTYGNNWAAARSVGTLAAGSQTLLQTNISFTGNSAGNSQPICVFNEVISSGSETYTNIETFRNRARHDGTSTASNMRSVVSDAQVTNSGIVSNFDGFRSQITVSGTGNATSVNQFNAALPSLTSTGAITTLNGFAAGNLGHATLVTNAIGFNAANMTASATLTVSFRSQQNSGTGVWGFLHTGTANNAFNGNVRIGSNVAPTVSLDVTGSALISGGIGIATRNQVSTYTVAVGDFAIYANASGAAFTVTLPHASSLPNKIYVVKKTDSSGNAVTVSSVSNIDGATTTSLAAQFNKIMLQSNATQWYEI